MKVVRIILTGLFVTTLLNTAAACCAQHGAGSMKAKIMFAENRCFAKGGIGIINTSLYIDLKSTANELIVDPGGKRWRGSPVPIPEVVVFFAGKVWPPQQLPGGFDLSRSIVISFEHSRVRFFDFEKLEGGYYLREKP